MSHPQDNPEVVLDVDENDDDTRSDYGPSIASSSTSLASSILNHRLENGRTYHRYKDGKYNLPNDERENERQDMVHNLWLLTIDGKLGLAPPCNNKIAVGRVLDVGTGPGTWAVHFGDEHPDAEVYGIDLSPTFPNVVPPNVRFEVDDVEDEWAWSRPFEYIHSRVLTSSINDWPLYLRRCFENLQPGGYLELQELDVFPSSDDGTLKPDSPLSKWANLLSDASNKMGRPYIQIPRLKDMMTEIGFEVTMSVYKWPTNAWPKEVHFKELGMWQNENMLAGLEAFTMAPLTRALEWTRAEVDVFLVDVRKEVNNRNVHAYWPIYFIVGRKPEKSEGPAVA